MIRRTALAGLVATAAVSITSFAFADQAIPQPQNAPPPLTIPSGSIQPPSAPASPPSAPETTTSTPSATPPAANQLPGTTGNGLANANSSVFAGMPSGNPPAGDTHWAPNDEDGYNHPSAQWYQDLYTQIYYSYFYAGEVERYYYAEYYNNYNSGEYYADSYEMYVEASYVRYYYQEYFWTYFRYDDVSKSVALKTYDFDSEGQHFHDSAPWREYFIYNYFYYIQPMYNVYLKHAKSYRDNYGSHHHDNYDHEVVYGGQSYGKFSQHHHDHGYYHHGWENCVYSFMSTDKAGPTDGPTNANERALGIVLDPQTTPAH